MDIVSSRDIALPLAFTWDIEVVNALILCPYIVVESAIERFSNKILSDPKVQNGIHVNIGDILRELILLLYYSRDDERIILSPDKT